MTTALPPSLSPFLPGTAVCRRPHSFTGHHAVTYAYINVREPKHVSSGFSPNYCVELRCFATVEQGTVTAVPLTPSALYGPYLRYGIQRPMNKLLVSRAGNCKGLGDLILFRQGLRWMSYCEDDLNSPYIHADPPQAAVLRQRRDASQVSSC